jgi:hypothetical protein
MLSNEVMHRIILGIMIEGDRHDFHRFSIQNYRADAVNGSRFPVSVVKQVVQSIQDEEVSDANL